MHLILNKLRLALVCIHRYIRPLFANVKLVRLAIHSLDKFNNNEIASRRRLIPERALPDEN